MKKRTVFAGLIFLLFLSLAFLGCPGAETKEIEVIKEVPIDKTPEYGISIDRNALYFFAPVNSPVTSPGSVSIVIGNIGTKATGDLDVKINGNTWLKGSRDPEEQDGSGSFFTDTASLRSIAPGKSTTLTISAIEFLNPTVTFPSYIQPAVVEIEISNSNIKKTVIKYTVGTYQSTAAAVGLFDTNNFPEVPRVGAVFPVYPPPDSILVSIDSRVAMFEGTDIRFISEGQVTVGYITGNGKTIDYIGEDNWKADPFVFNFQRIFVTKANPFWIEKAVMGDAANQIDVFFSEPVKNIDATKFLLLNTDRNMSERLDRSNTGGDVVPLLPFASSGGGLLIAPSGHANGTIQMRFAEKDFTDTTVNPTVDYKGPVKRDAEGKVWRLNIGPEKLGYNPQFDGRKFPRIDYGSIVRLAVIEAGAAVHATDNTPLPKIESVIVDVSKIGMSAIRASDDQLAAAGFYQSFGVNAAGIPGYHSSQTATEKITFPDNATDPDYKDGDEYLLRNALVYINKINSTSASPANTRNRGWIVVLDKDQIMDLAGTGNTVTSAFPNASFNGKFNDSVLRISAVTGAVSGTKTSGKVTVTWTAKGGLTARNGLSIWINGGGTNAATSKLVFDGGGTAAANPVKDMNRWVGADAGGKVILDSAVIFENLVFEAALPTWGGAGLFVIGQASGAAFIVNNAVIRNNKVKTTNNGDNSGEVPTGATWPSTPFAGGISVSMGGVLVIYGGEISNNTAESTTNKLPRAGGVVVGTPNISNNSEYVWNSMFFMTGGKISNNTAGGNDCTAAGGIFAGSSVFQKIGGEVTGNSVTGNKGALDGPQVASVIRLYTQQPSAANYPRDHVELYKGNVDANTSLFLDYNGVNSVNRLNPPIAPLWWVSKWDK